MGVRSLALFAVFTCASTCLAAPRVYTGYAVTFEKTPFVDPFLAANHDAIVSDVKISRGDTQGIFNVAREGSYISNISPAGTSWAFNNNNSGETLSASNWPALTFESWETALGGTRSLAGNIVDGNAVLHLVDHDIYLDIRFTSWGAGGSGGIFRYERAAIVAIPEPSTLLLGTIFLLSLPRRGQRRGGH